jgi:hypothetical protein
VEIYDYVNLFIGGPHDEDLGSMKPEAIHFMDATAIMDMIKKVISNNVDTVQKKNASKVISIQAEMNEFMTSSTILLTKKVKILTCPFLCL